MLCSLLQSKGEEMNKCFEPIYDENSRVLVLGSFPSVISRKNNFYYGNPRNRFWHILETVFCEKVPETADGKKKYVLRHRVALWDTVSECDISGSADSKIDKRKLKPNDLKKLLANAPNLTKIVCNGKKAYEIFMYYFGDEGYNVELLPSTSPANTWFDIEPWQRVLNEAKQ